MEEGKGKAVDESEGAKLVGGAGLPGDESVVEGTALPGDVPVVAGTALAGDVPGLVCVEEECVGEDIPVGAGDEVWGRGGRPGTAEEACELEGSILYSGWLRLVSRLLLVILAGMSTDADGGGRI